PARSALDRATELSTRLPRDDAAYAGLRGDLRPGCRTTGRSRTWSGGLGGRCAFFYGVQRPLQTGTRPVEALPGAPLVEPGGPLPVLGRLPLVQLHQAPLDDLRVHLRLRSEHVQRGGHVHVRSVQRTG